MGTTENTTPGPRGKWLFSRGYDLSFFIFPSLGSVLIAFFLTREFPEKELSPFLWVVFVLFMDVSHVYATLFRTYLVPREFAKRRTLYTFLPIAVFVVLWGLHMVSSHLFWSVMAYYAVFHFIKQHWGFAALYRRQASETRFRLWDKWAVYLGALIPMLYWHTHLPRNYVWFTKQDFLSLPQNLWSDWIFVASALFLLSWSGKNLFMGIRYGQWNPGRDLVTWMVWLTWFTGIVWLNSDLAFSITNVMIHGVSYMALVWAVNRKRLNIQEIPASRRPLFRHALFYVSVLLALAYGEEFFWHFFVWHENASVFGPWVHRFYPPAEWVSALVALLSVPQVTHYFLDGIIWKKNEPA